MSFGIRFENKYGNVLISSETKTLHFYERIDSPSETEVPSDLDFAGGAARAVYTCNLSTAYRPVPFFTIPQTSPEQYVGCTRVWQSGGKWKIELLSNQYAVPQVYVFVEPQAAPSYGDYGITVRDRNGVPTFDSAKAPLVIAGEYDPFTMNSNPRTPNSTGLSARDGSSNGSAAHGARFAPQGTSLIYNNNPLPNKPIFHYMSTPQAQRSITVTESRRDCIERVCGSCVKYRTSAWVSRYWMYYRTGISRNRCKWIPRYWDAAYTSKFEEGFELLGIDLGNVGGLLEFALSDGSYSGGAHPYENESFNLDQPETIFADASLYDQLID